MLSLGRGLFCPYDFLQCLFGLFPGDHHFPAAPFTAQAEIHPHPEHMYSHITAILLCNAAQPDALELLERYKKSANFKLSLHGWMEYRIAAVDLSTAEVFTNRKGKELKKSLAKVIDFETKRKTGEEKKSV